MKESMTLYFSTSQSTDRIISPVLSMERYFTPASFGLWQHRSLHQQLYVDRQLLDCYCCKLANSAIICATWNLIKSLIFWWTVWEWRSDPALHVWHFVLASQQHLLRVHPLKGSFAGAVAVWPYFPCSCCFPVCSPMRNPLKPLN